jgi:hypothetical protein
MATATVRERLETMDDFQIVRFFQHWSSSLSNGAVTGYGAIVDGLPAEISASPTFAAIIDLTPEQAVASVHPADSVLLARALLEPLASTPEVGPTIAAALDSFHDEKLVVDVILAIGLVTSVLLIVSTIEFEGKIGPMTFRKGKVDPETLKALTGSVGGLLAPYLKQGG